VWGETGVLREFGTRDVYAERGGVDQPRIARSICYDGLYDGDSEDMQTGVAYRKTVPASSNALLPFRMSKREKDLLQYRLPSKVMQEDVGRQSFRRRSSVPLTQTPPTYQSEMYQFFVPDDPDRAS
jgi:hypothetical protein